MQPITRDLDEVLTAARRTAPGWFRSDLRVALAVLVAGLALLAVGLSGLWAQDDALDPDRWWHAVPLVLGTAVMLGKRRRPLLALAAGLVLLAVDLALGGSLGTLLVVLDLLYSAALFSSRTGRQVLVVAAWSLVGVAAAVAGVASDGEPRAVATGAIQAAGFLVVPLWWAGNVRATSEVAVLAEERAALASANAEGLARIEELRRRDAVQAERRTMARDLHDVVAGHVSAVAIRTGAALAGPAGRERETLEMARTSSLAALEEMRAMILLLRADDPAAGPVSAPGTLADLAGVVAGHRDAGAEIVLEDRAPRGLPAAVEQAALRIVQEALTNVAKHGAGGEVRVVLEEVEDSLSVCVTSPLPVTPAASPAGRGAAAPGTGLLSMRERAEGLGGTLEVGPEAGLWSVRSTIPLTPGGAP
ncbi:signal transduction histidine kinase [Sanguibacter keddieii DSM 10542]|uniref:histidine kinase n=1 Tax=Sanguibacter keddieii (strain ATCC 51767 / DSM 10542 / NCFB 3025 / ST-74) TaxID=446469 RepID=D1BGP9_SANKS|nr:histidine kinase [Sanguibacter keddieii]ACZ21626.1 signal transduction histidine kinase [Sanguibacter keddieii DSM 10542]